MTSHLTTLQKAKKILGYCEQLEPRKYCVQPHSRSNKKNKHQLSFSSASKSESKMKRDFSFCKSKSKLENSMSVNQSDLRHKQQRNTSFVSSYGRETRYDKIMKLKVKPHFDGTKKNDRNKKSVLNNSFSSCNSRDQGKQNKVRNKLNRLEKIMQIKVNKPKVNSTLIYYQPRHGSKSQQKVKRESVVKQWKQCREKIQKTKDQQQKEDRLWKVFERERELRQKLKKDATEREFRQQRRKEQRFENMVSKEVLKIEQEREVARRRTDGFSNYLYPFY